MKPFTKPHYLTCSSLSQSCLKATALLALCVYGCADDAQSEASVSGKKKIAYAPYQNAEIKHHSPIKVKSTVAATQEQISSQIGAVVTSTISTSEPSTFTAPQIAKDAQSQAPVNPYEQSKIAAGWPGGPQGENPQVTKGTPAPSPSTAPSMKAPSSQPSSRPMAKPASMPTGAPNSHAQQEPVAVANYVYGEISLDPTMVGSVKPGSVLFVVVRRHIEGGQGMLIAATKQANITKDSFPIQYVVKQQDAMMGAPLVGQVTVSARIDQDGDAISKQPGDLVTDASAPVMVGKNPVKLIVNKAL